ncbi:hypothetical protein EVA_13976 [gut metagenome]|uniref:Uncharacterized protein n=1 Tax=gut metagenome TaxID=749906 RepID=J9FSI1_9ZZZZ
MTVVHLTTCFSPTVSLWTKRVKRCLSRRVTSFVRRK